MPTRRQTDLIKELLEELGWDKDDIASELISELIDRKREMDREERY